jgi:GNAT superfamily N-acetyltransferase
MIGVAALGASSADEGRVVVAVAPAWRRLHLGTDLLHALAAEAPRWNLGHLRISYPADTVAADLFVGSCGLPAVRGVVNGVSTAVLFLAPVPAQERRPAPPSGR